jgi:glycosyltransferase involved in cell wall biosynthesis
MIVRDEEEVIGRCLDSVKDLVDEIIIVDTGSTDSTKEIVSKYTDKIYDFEWIDDFAAARNRAFSEATKDFIMWLDADDVLFEEDREDFMKFRESLDDSIDMVMLKYNVAFDEQGAPTYSFFRERVFNRKNNYQWIGKIHEVIVPQGNLINVDVPIAHKPVGGKDPRRNLKIFQKMIAGGDELVPRELFYYARELYYNKEYDEAIETFNEFLNKDSAWVEDRINACKDLSVCYYQIGENTKALHAMYRSFEYDVPRPEICCDIGKHFYDREKFEISIFWYKTALEKNIEDFPQGFKINDCYDFLPCIQLSVCLDRLGRTEEAIYYHEKAKKIKPDNEAVKYNEEYFKGVRRSMGSEKIK